MDAGVPKRPTSPDEAPSLLAGRRLLIANRGEGAARVLRTAKACGMYVLCIYAQEDERNGYLLQADKAVRIENSDKVRSPYLDIQQIINIAVVNSIDTLHPVYGYLSETPELVEACQANNITFVGPTAVNMRSFALKDVARSIAKAACIPIIEGSGLLTSVEQALEVANTVGYPVIIKGTAAGGGIAHTICTHPEELPNAFNIVKQMAKNHFGNDGLFLEKYIRNARHIETQIFGFGKTACVVGTRECSIQRRHQKIIEECPSPYLKQHTDAEKQLAHYATELATSVEYWNAGTVEWLFDSDSDEYYFLEVNTRLQVEHVVTEQVFDIDLVEWQLRSAADKMWRPSHLKDKGTLRESGCSIECRLNTEDPLKAYTPSVGEIESVSFPEEADGFRLENYIENGTAISGKFDPMVSKLIATGKDRAEAIQRMIAIVKQTAVYGVQTNLEQLNAILESHEFQMGFMQTSFLKTFQYTSKAVEVVSPGFYSSIQDCGRPGYWKIGIPPSGAYDSLNSNIANAILSNSNDAPVLEMTLSGADLKFHSPSVICLTGGRVDATLNDAQINMYTEMVVPQGSVLRIGKLRTGLRCYLAVQGGFRTAKYLGSSSAFPLGGLGRTLKVADYLWLQDKADGSVPIPKPTPADILRFSHPDQMKDNWKLKCMIGPFASEEYVSESSMSQFFNETYEVHFNSNRLGIRLMGKSLTWTRESGGTAGLHPSNLHDYVYQIGSLNFTGDTPIIIGVDGPSLGGFVTNITVIKAELWKIGQLKTGDKVRFQPVTYAEAVRIRAIQDKLISDIYCKADTDEPEQSSVLDIANAGGILKTIPADVETGQPRVEYRCQGDMSVLVQYGDDQLSIPNRFRIEKLINAIKAKGEIMITELCPGIRSLQVNYESQKLHVSDLLHMLTCIEAELNEIATPCLPSRVVHLPLSFDDPCVETAIKKYTKSVCKNQLTKPYLPSNIDFICRMNGLEGGPAEVKRILLESNYLVLGLGDVYMSSVAAVPVDPRHRLITSKYNPARTWTQDGTIGIGGSYLCSYGISSPGGYQLVGRSLGVFQKHPKHAVFGQNPWFMRCFDQIRFYDCTAEELVRLRREFECGTLDLRVEDVTFDLRDYLAFIEEHKDSIELFRERQQTYLDKEVKLWQSQGFIGSNTMTSDVEEQKDDDYELGQGEEFVMAQSGGSIWKISTQEGCHLKKGDTMLVVEVMKMELPLTAAFDCQIKCVFVTEGLNVRTGDNLFVVLRI
ncbi:urea amidolyase-like [Patiria miniata]|uniref:Urea carboxylase n=1 Tax=Patiria miniata TaxID=46514 RepID=A0A913ZP49_PATMI|nr:urea amidolyase-like [Patiria miniata]